VSAGGLQVSVLGELEVGRGGASLELPPSRKSRALLGYLVVTRRSQRRERLCELFWDVTDDRRGALRWSLSRLRAVVDHDGERHILADRQACEFDPTGVEIDLFAARAVAARADAASIDELEAAAQRFRGELLAGGDLHGFDDFQAWLVAQREEALRLRATICRALVARLADAPGRAARHAATLVEADPLDEASRASLIRLLLAAGRRREAEQALDAARRAFVELAGREPPLLRQLELELRQRPAAAPTPAAVEPAPARSVLARTTIHGLRLIGRQAEVGGLAAALDEVAARRRAAVKLIRGEPGVGKSRMLVALITEARKRAGSIVEGLAYEAEIARPFGPWLDALRPAAGDDPSGGGRDRLFAAVVEALAARARAAPFVLVALDDLHWFDPGSVELLHYAVRSARELPVLFALTVRAGELADNAPALRTLRSLRREASFEELELGPLGRDDTGELARLVQRAVDVDEVFRESGGNPLFALEVARAAPRGEAGEGATLAKVVRDRIAALPPAAADVLRWAAVLGPVFRVAVLGDLVAAEPGTLAGLLEELERHAVIGGVIDPADPGGTYQFAHHVVRRVVYDELSGPRRRLMHAQVVRVLARRTEAADPQAAELAHHALEAGDLVTAASASVRAVRYCLQMFAPGQALALARRALRQVADLPPITGAPLARELEALVAEAEAAAARTNAAS
jgi:DNA-binding SARP family transcriptional activator